MATGAEQHNAIVATAATRATHLPNDSWRLPPMIDSTSASNSLPIQFIRNLSYPKVSGDFYEYFEIFLSMSRYPSPIEEIRCLQLLAIGRCLSQSCSAWQYLQLGL